MGDNFQGTDSITLQPGDENVPIYLRLVAASASTKNDGSMPYGSSVLSVATKIHRGAGGADATTYLLSSSAISANTIIAYLTYDAPGSSRSWAEHGLYNITATVTMDLDGAIFNMTRQYDLNRLYVRDL
jgi:hypothetical protein